MGKPKPAKSGKAAEPAQPAPLTAQPSWPAFKPPLPVSDLDIETIIDDKVVVLRSFFPKSLCRDYVSFLRTLPLTTTPGKPKRGYAVRQNDRFQIESPQFAARLWLETGLKDALLGDEAAAKLW